MCEHKFVLEQSWGPGIINLKLNNPQKLNPMNDALMEELLELLKMYGDDETIRVIVLTAEGKHFSGGGDIESMKRNIASNMAAFGHSLDLVSKLFQTIRLLRKPVIAAVHGAVMGGAFDLILSCDFCIAAEDTFFSLAFVNLGLIPDTGGMFLLSRAMGFHRASQLAMTGQKLTAAQANDLGLIYEVVPNDELNAHAIELASKLAKGPTLAYAEIKRVLYDAQFSDFSRYSAREKEAQIHCAQSRDCWEALTAFTERRPAIFIGK